MSDPGFVYLVQSGDDYRFKIGRTVNLPRRMRTLQLGSPVPLYLIGWHRTPDPVEHERQWHKNLGLSRRHGEWFDLNLQQLRLFNEFAHVFTRLNRKPCVLDHPTYFVSFGKGEIIEVQISEFDFSEDPLPLLKVEAVQTENGEALLYDPHTKAKSYQETFFEVYADCLATDPRGALIYRVMDNHPFKDEDMSLHLWCEKELGHRFGYGS